MPADRFGTVLNRTTTIRFDVFEPALSEPPNISSRDTKSISPQKGSEVERIGNGGWQLKPISVSQTQELTPTSTFNPVQSSTGNGGPLIIGSTWNEVNNTQSPSGLLNATTGASPNLNTAGDLVIQRAISAVAPNNSWQDSTHAADLNAYPQPVFPTAPNIVVDRAFVANILYDSDQPFHLRFEIPSTPLHNPDTVKLFYFGDYMLRFRGDGLAELWMQTKWLYSPDLLHASMQSCWVFLDRWQYSHPHQVMRQGHSFRITPQTGPGIRTVNIKSGPADTAQPNSSLLNAYYNAGTQPTDHTVNITNAFSQAAQGGGLTNAGITTDQQLRGLIRRVRERPYTSSPAPIRGDVRRDLKLRFQVAIPTYPASAYLLDAPITFTGVMSNLNPITLMYNATLPPGCSITAAIVNPSTGTPYPVTSSTSNSITINTPQGVNRYQAQFTLNSNAAHTKTPILWAYRIYRSGRSDPQPLAGEFSNGVLRSVDITGIDDDITHNTANVKMDDPKYVMSRVYNRGVIPVIIQTSYVEPPPPPLPGQNPGPPYIGTSVLFQGYATRNPSQRKGTYDRPGQYPDPRWSSFDINCVGMWMRLQQAQMPFGIAMSLAWDPGAAADPTGMLIPYKVTDMIRLAISWAGFPSSSIDIPDLPLRFFPSPGSNYDSLTIQPNSSIGDWIKETIDFYFGHRYFLTFDANAGSNGMWRMIPASVPNSVGAYSIVATFMSQSLSGGIKSIIHPGTYGISKTFIQRGTYRTWNVPLEGNLFTVVGVGKEGPGGQIVKNVWNRLSVNMLGQNTANPNHADYRGVIVPVVMIDPGLDTNEAVWWAAKQLYNKAGHTLAMCSFTAPLILVQPTDPILDPNNSLAGTLPTTMRPLRYYDPVSVVVDGIASTYLIKSVNISYHRDNVQMATYEMQKPPQFI